MYNKIGKTFKMNNAKTCPVTECIFLWTKGFVNHTEVISHRFADMRISPFTVWYNSHSISTGLHVQFIDNNQQDKAAIFSTILVPVFYTNVIT